MHIVQIWYINDPFYKAKFYIWMGHVLWHCSIQTEISLSLFYVHLMKRLHWLKFCWVCRFRVGRAYHWCVDNFSGGGGLKGVCWFLQGELSGKNTKKEADFPLILQSCRSFSRPLKPPPWLLTHQWIVTLSAWESKALNHKTPHHTQSYVWLPPPIENLKIVMLKCAILSQK